MASHQNRSFKKKCNSELVSTLRKETESLRKEVVDSHHRYSSLNDVLEVSTDDIRKLQSDLKDALEKNKQWLEYDQQREAYVRAVLARMIWLDKQLNEANQACSLQHNETHSDVDAQIIQMQEHCERLLQKAKDNLEKLTDELVETQQNLQCVGNEREEEEFKQQLQTEKAKQEEATEEHLSDEIGDLRCMLTKERRKSAHLEHQAGFHEAYSKSLYHEEQRKIAGLERQIKISAQDLEDERQNCLYLKKQREGLVKMLQNFIDPLSSSLKDESCLECPFCQTLYPARDYNELIHHLEDCQS